MACHRVKATGEPTSDFAAERLFEPLGMAHTRMTKDASGRSTNTYFGLQTTCLDLGRFARLFLEQGEVGSRRILSRGYVEGSVGQPSTGHDPAYGYLWWLNREGQLRGATDAVDEEGQPLEPREGRLVPGARRRCTPRSASAARSRWSTRGPGPSWSGSARGRRAPRSPTGSPTLPGS